MPRAVDAPPITRAVVLRGVLLALALGLGAVGVWLIVTGKTQRRLELGVLAGLWGLLLGTFAMMSKNRSGAGGRGDEWDDQPALSASAQESVALELRRRMDLERAQDAETRRAFEARLEQMLRQELRTAMGEEIRSLRAEINELRGELLETVGGQLRLERIETTRVIGSDIAALQHEVRQLVSARDEVEYATPRRPAVSTSRPIVEPARVRPISREADAVQYDIQPARSDLSVTAPIGEAVARPFAPAGPTSSPASAPPTAAVAPPPAAPDMPPSSPPVQPAASLASSMPSPGAPRTPPAGVPPAPPAAQSAVPPPVIAHDAPRSAPDVDGFASLPRLRPFTDFELDPIDSTPGAATPPAAGSPASAELAAQPTASDYSGRRRAAASDGDGEPVGRRRRRAESAEDSDLLTRLLARAQEGSR